MPCCGLIPGGAWKQITAGQAGRILESVTPAGAVAAARWELAAEHAAGLRGIDAQIRQTRKKIDAAVRGAGTSLTGIFGAGPVIAAAVIGDVRDVSRFPSRDHFASCNGTAPVEVSPGQRKTCRLSRRGSRRLNHAIHMAAVTQIRCRHSNGRAYYDKKLAEGKTPEEALRALKRQVSDAIYTVLPAGARKAAGQPGEPGRATGAARIPARPAHTPRCRLFGKATPGPPASLRRHRPPRQIPLLPFPALLPTRASGQAVQDRAQPGRAAAPERASLTRPPGEPTMPGSGKKKTPCPDKRTKRRSTWRVGCASGVFVLSVQNGPFCCTGGGRACDQVSAPFTGGGASRWLVSQTRTPEARCQRLARRSPTCLDLTAGRLPGVGFRRSLAPLAALVPPVPRAGAPAVAGRLWQSGAAGHGPPSLRLA
jgi:hypothetical protein